MILSTKNFIHWRDIFWMKQHRWLFAITIFFGWIRFYWLL